ncbi:uncharacterized protein [Eurosta solidaginis]|uniref:uncharacterized protein n=1 Tax=Eurosta solidaginis TaxID=178769 RepID=UPI00353172BC
MSFREFELNFLEAHNKYRAHHGSPPSSLDRDLCNYAQEWARNLANRNILQHRSNNSYGENIYMTMGNENGVSAQDAVQRWYDEVRNYSFKNGGFGGSTGHFTQVVWKGSQRLGVGVARSGHTTFVVANYDPPGNYNGEYQKNVLHYLGHLRRNFNSKMARNQGLDDMQIAKYLQNLSSDYSSSEEDSEVEDELLEDVVWSDTEDKTLMKKINMATVKHTVIIKKVPPGGNPNQPPPIPITMAQNDYEKACVEMHNKYRAMHGTPPLTINPTLTGTAAKWAQDLAKRQKMEHSPDGKFGENIYFSSGQQVTPEMPVKMWYDEIAKYDFAKSIFNPYTGHFTQLIWRDTKQVGVAYALNGEKCWVVANYDPPGNVNGFFKDNVPPKK